MYNQFNSIKKIQPKTKIKSEEIKIPGKKTNFFIKNKENESFALEILDKDNLGDKELKKINSLHSKAIKNAYLRPLEYYKNEKVETFILKDKNDDLIGLFSFDASQAQQYKTNEATAYVMEDNQDNLVIGKAFFLNSEHQGKGLMSSLFIDIKKILSLVNLEKSTITMAEDKIDKDLKLKNFTDFLPNSYINAIRFGVKEKDELTFISMINNKTNLRVVKHINKDGNFDTKTKNLIPFSLGFLFNPRLNRFELLSHKLNSKNLKEEEEEIAVPSYIIEYLAKAELLRVGNNANNGKIYKEIEEEVLEDIKSISVEFHEKISIPKTITLELINNAKKLEAKLNVNLGSKRVDLFKKEILPLGKQNSAYIQM